MLSASFSASTTSASRLALAWSLAAARSALRAARWASTSDDQTVEARAERCEIADAVGSVDLIAKLSDQRHGLVVGKSRFAEAMLQQVDLDRQRGVLAFVECDPVGRVAGEPLADLDLVVRTVRGTDED